jgi:2-polyprenyl-6-methoxyphenol hydroxylase-like FAD-dependent oxidoreductase
MSNDGRHGPHALVVGGSLAGLTAALALARVGARVSVLERSPAGHYEGGGGLGVDLPLLAHVTGILESPPVCQGIDRATTAWPLLVDWLEAHARRTEGIAIHRGTEALTVGDAWVQTADGARHDSDVVIGADGTGSTLRRWVASGRWLATNARDSPAHRSTCS